VLPYRPMFYRISDTEATIKFYKPVLTGADGYFPNTSDKLDITQNPLEEGDIISYIWRLKDTYDNWGNDDQRTTLLEERDLFLVVDTYIDGNNDVYVKVVPSTSAMKTTDVGSATDGYYFKYADLKYFDKIYYANDFGIIEGGELVAYDGKELLEALVQSIWSDMTVTIVDGSSLRLPLEYFNRLIDYLPFDRSPLDAIKFMATALNAYLWVDSSGNMKVKKWSNLASASVTEDLDDYLGRLQQGSKRYFWDKLVDGVELYLKTWLKELDVEGNFTGYFLDGGGYAYKKLLSQPRNVLKKEMIIDEESLSAYSVSIDPLDDYSTNSQKLNYIANQKALEYLQFYGQRHGALELSFVLSYDMLSWDMTNVFTFNSDKYFTTGIDIDIVNNTVTFELISVTAYPYDEKTVLLEKSGSIFGGSDTVGLNNRVTGSPTVYVLGGGTTGGGTTGELGLITEGTWQGDPIAGTYINYNTINLTNDIGSYNLSAVGEDNDSPTNAVLTTSSSHNYRIGTVVTLADMSAYIADGEYTVIDVPSSTSFTIDTTPSNTGAVTGTVSSSDKLNTIQDINILSEPTFYGLKIDPSNTNQYADYAKNTFAFEISKDDGVDDYGYFSMFTTGEDYGGLSADFYHVTDPTSYPITTFTINPILGIFFKHDLATSLLNSTSFTLKNDTSTLLNADIENLKIAINSETAPLYQLDVEGSFRVTDSIDTTVNYLLFNSDDASFKLSNASSYLSFIPDDGASGGVFDIVTTTGGVMSADMDNNRLLVGSIGSATHTLSIAGNIKASNSGGTSFLEFNPDDGADNGTFNIVNNSNLILDVDLVPSSEKFTFYGGGSGANIILMDEYGRLGLGVGTTVPEHELTFSDDYGMGSANFQSGWQNGYGWELDEFTLSTSSKTIVSISWDSNQITVTTSTDHGFTHNDRVTISGCTKTTYNRSYYVHRTPTTTTFTAALYLPSDPGNEGAGATVATTWGHEYTLEIDNLYVRGAMSVWELLVQQIRVTNGNLLVTAAAKATTGLIYDGSYDGGLYYFEVDDVTGHGIAPFYPDDIIMSQIVNLNGVITVPDFDAVYDDQWELKEDALQLVRRNVFQVYEIEGLKVYVIPHGSISAKNKPDDQGGSYSGDGEGTLKGHIEKGDGFARIGNVTEPTRKGMVGIYSDDRYAPYIRITGDVSSYADWKTQSASKVLLGKLDGISDDDFLDITFEGSGAYFQDNIYMKGNIVLTNIGNQMTQGSQSIGIGNVNHWDTPPSNAITISNDDYSTSTSGFFLHDGSANQVFRASLDGVITLGNTTADTYLEWSSTTGILTLRGAVRQSTGGINYGELRGAWAVSTLYIFNDVVSHNGVAYRCKSEHTSDDVEGSGGQNVNEPDLGSSWTTYWEVWVEGSSAQLIHMTSDHLVFAEQDDETGSLDPTTITFNLELQGILASEIEAWTATNDQSQSIDFDTGGGATDTSATIIASDFGASQWVEVTAGDGTNTDTITVYRVKEGSDAITVILKNEAHLVACTSDGDPYEVANGDPYNALGNGSGAESDVVVLWGSTQLDPVDSNPDNGEFAITNVSGSGCTAIRHVSDFDHIYVTAMSSDLAFVDITITAKVRNSSRVTQKQMVLKKVLDASSGIDAYTAQILSESLIVKYDENENITYPLTALTLTAKTTGFPLDAEKYGWLKLISGSSLGEIKGDWVGGTSYVINDTVYYSNNFYVCKTAHSTSQQPNVATTYWNPAEDLTVTYNLLEADYPDIGSQDRYRLVVREVVGGITYIQGDVTSIVGLKDGVDSITVVMTNEAHTVACDVDGNPIDTLPDGFAETDITVYRGTTEMTAIPSSGTLTQNQWQFTGVPQAINCTGTYETTSPYKTLKLNAISTGEHNGSLSANIKYNIGGSDVTLTYPKKFTWSISKTGATGLTGAGFVYRGLYDSDEYYYCNATRKDLVKHSGHYYIAENEAKDELNTWIAPSGEPNADWQSFGAEFDSVATKLLLAHDAVITNTLTMGGADGQGIIHSAGISSIIDSGAGYWLASDETNVYSRFGTFATSALVKGFYWDGDDYELKSFDTNISSKDSVYWDNVGTTSGNFSTRYSNHYSSSFTSGDVDNFVFTGTNGSQNCGAVDYSGDWVMHIQARQQNSSSVWTEGNESAGHFTNLSGYKPFVVTFDASTNITNFVGGFIPGEDEASVVVSIHEGSSSGAEVGRTSVEISFSGHVENSYVITGHTNASYLYIKCRLDLHNTFYSSGSYPTLDAYFDSFIMRTWDPLMEVTPDGFLAFASNESFIQAGAEKFVIKGVDLETRDVIIRGNLIVHGSTEIATPASAIPTGYDPNVWDRIKVLNSKGKLLTYNANVAVADIDDLAVGTDGYVLTADSTSDYGLSWKDPNTTASTTLTLVNESSDVSNYLIFANDSTGDQTPKTNASLTYSASTNIIGASGIVAPTGSNLVLDFPSNISNFLDIKVGGTKAWYFNQAGNFVPQGDIGSVNIGTGSSKVNYVYTTYLNDTTNRVTKGWFTDINTGDMTILTNGKLAFNDYYTFELYYNGTTATISTGVPLDITAVSNDITFATGSSSEDRWKILANNGDFVPQGTQDIGATASRVDKGWFTDLEITNAPTINGSALTMSHLASYAVGDLSDVDDSIVANGHTLIYLNGTWGTGLISGVTNVTTALDTTDTVAYIGFVNSTAETQQVKTNTSLTFNATNGTLSATTFSGSLDWSNIASKPTTLSGYGITDTIVKSVTAGNGLVDSGTATDPSIAVDFTELSPLTGLSSVDYFVTIDITDDSSRKSLASGISLSIFNDDLDYPTALDDLTDTDDLSDADTGHILQNASGLWNNVNPYASTGDNLGSAWTFARSDHSHYLNDLANVDANEFTADNDILQYNTTSGNWEAVSLNTAFGFVLEDGDGTEVDIDSGDEIKFSTFNGGLIIGYDGGDGSDATPYRFNWKLDFQSLGDVATQADIYYIAGTKSDGSSTHRHPVSTFNLSNFNNDLGAVLYGTSGSFTSSQKFNDNTQLQFGTGTDSYITYLSATKVLNWNNVSAEVTSLNIRFGVDTRFTVSSTGGSLAGTWTGTIANATDATNASNITLATSTANSAHYIPFALSGTGNQSLKTFSGITYNPSTDKLFVSTLSVSKLDTTTNGFVKTSSSNGTVTIDPTTYLTSSWTGSSSLVTVGNIISNMGAELSSGLSSTDELLISDGGVIKKMDVSVLATYIQSGYSLDLTDLGDYEGDATPSDGEILVWETDADNGWYNRTLAEAGISAVGHTHTSSTISALNAGDVTSGYFSVARGGTGRSSLTSNLVLVGNGTASVSLISRSGIDSRSEFPPSSHTHTGVYEPVDSTILREADISIDPVAAPSGNTVPLSASWAYGHLVTHAPDDAQKNSDITKSEIEAKLTGTITSHSHNYGTGTVTSVTGGNGLDGSVSTSGSLNLNLGSGTIEGAGTLVSADSFALLDDGSGTTQLATLSQLETYMQNNLSFTNNTGDITRVTGTGSAGGLSLSGDTTSGDATITLSGSLSLDLNTLSNVYTTSVTDKSVLSYVSGNSRWENKTISAAGIQAALVSGTNIKTVNSTTILGSGNIGVGVTSVSGGTGLTGTVTGTGSISHLTTNGYRHIPSNGAGGQILQWSSQGTAQWWSPTYTSNTGTVTSVTVGTGLDVDNGTTTPYITLDLSEFTDMTADVVGSADELILLDNGAERRKMINEIKLGQFNNDQGWTSNTGTVGTYNNLTQYYIPVVYGTGGKTLTNNSGGFTQVRYD
jgi:hypothetical protein